jgi:hypothetical protein
MYSGAMQAWAQRGRRAVSAIRAGSVHGCLAAMYRIRYTYAHAHTLPAVCAKGMPTIGGTCAGRCGRRGA